MVSSGSGNSWLINWDNSSVGVSNQLGVEVQGTGITIGWGISGVGNSWSSSIRNWSIVVSSHWSRCVCSNWRICIGNSWSGSKWSSS